MIITLFLTVYAGMKIHVVLIADYCKKKKRQCMIAAFKILMELQHNKTFYSTVFTSMPFCLSFLLHCVSKIKSTSIGSVD